MVQEAIGGIEYDMFKYSSNKGHFPVHGKCEEWATMCFAGSKTTRCAKRKGEKRPVVLACQCRYGGCALHSMIDLAMSAAATGAHTKVFRGWRRKRRRWAGDCQAAQDVTWELVCKTRCHGQRQVKDVESVLAHSGVATTERSAIDGREFETGLRIEFAI